MIFPIFVVLVGVAVVVVMVVMGVPVMVMVRHDLLVVNRGSGMVLGDKGVVIMMLGRMVDMGLVEVVIGKFGEVMFWPHFWTRLENVHFVRNGQRKVWPVVKIPAMMIVPTAGFDTVDDVDIYTYPVVGDLVVREVPAVRLNVHRML